MDQHVPDMIDGTLTSYVDEWMNMIHLWPLWQVHFASRLGSLCARGENGHNILSVVSSAASPSVCVDVGTEMLVVSTHFVPFPCLQGHKGENEYNRISCKPKYQRKPQVFEAGTIGATNVAKATWRMTDVVISKYNDTPAVKKSLGP